MAQLSDDCFAFGGPMMSVDEAVAIIAARVSPVQDIEAVLLAAADGRVLAKDISAPLPLPPFTNSAVDGYAVRSGDLPQAAEKAFPVVGRVQAGASAQAPVEAAHAVRIFTGARVPRGAAQLFDSNRFMLMAMLVRLGCEVSDLGILGDDRMALASALQNVADAHDLVLTTGGVSTGEEDHVKTAVESVGNLVLWRMAIKPGRPVAMGIIGGTPFIGLPGNPVASFVTFVHVVRPTVLALAGAAQQPLVPMPVRAAFTYKKKIARREYVRVNLRKADDGVLEVAKFPREGAGLLSSLVDTDGLVELGEDITRVEPGQTVGFLSYANLI